MKIEIDINKCRADNYALHFRRRAFAINHPERERIEKIVSNLPAPRLNLFGVEEFPSEACSGHWLMPSVYYDIARHLDIKEPGALLPWYWSVDGWEKFLQAWRDLSDPVSLRLEADNKVIHIYTQRVNSC